jgi:hypothetical protein
MKHVMVDLETLGTVPGCTMLSIGAVYFSPEGLGEEFHVVISRVSCKRAKLVEDPDTMEWWSKQSPLARKVLTHASSAEAVQLKDALLQLDAFLKLRKNVKLWGNGADFDNPILAVGYSRVKLKQAWIAWNGRCYRTLKNIAPGPKLVRVGLHHNALDDAKSQALHAIELFKLHPNLVMS